MEKEEGHWGGVWPFIYYPGQRIKLTSIFLSSCIKPQEPKIQALGCGLSSQGFLQGLPKLENEAPMCSTLNWCVILR